MDVPSSRALSAEHYLLTLETAGFFCLTRAGLRIKTQIAYLGSTQSLSGESHGTERDAGRFEWNPSKFTLKVFPSDFAPEYIMKYNCECVCVFFFKRCSCSEQCLLLLQLWCHVTACGELTVMTFSFVVPPTAVEQRHAS